MTMAAVKVLEFDEGVRLDSRPLEALHSDMGAEAAEAVLRRAMRELALRLARIEMREGIETMADLAQSARGIVGIAAEIGLTTLAEVAADVAAAAARCDVPAAAATAARLARVGDHSLMVAWTGVEPGA
jgi:hypothetical protein